MWGTKQIGSLTKKEEGSWRKVTWFLSAQEEAVMTSVSAYLGLLENKTSSPGQLSHLPFEKVPN